MAAQPLTLSDSYLAMVRGTRELHLLIAEGKDDSPEAEALRDATDGPWEAMTETERTRARLLSEDLFSLHEAPPVPQQMTVEAQRALLEVKDLQHAGEWDRALALIRSWRGYIAPFLVSYLRGSIWYDAGDFPTAAMFFKHAYDLKPDNGFYLAMYLACLSHANDPRTLAEADKVLSDYKETLLSLS